jgi:hypothetical protein
MRLVSGVENTGSALLFSVQPPDCDANGVPDVCETDCNYNLVADVCELLANTVDDCNANGVPDECENGLEYVIDTGIGLIAWGAGQCPADPIDMIWLNQFHVVAGGQRINRVAFAWLSWAGQTPGTILIYDDPDNDGDPSDAVLLSSTPAVSLDAFGLVNPVLFTIYEVPATDVGEIGESFFVGMKMSLECGVFPAVADTSPNNPASSWRISAPIGTGNIDHPAANPTVVLMTSEWAVRASGFDCNANGVWDQCDIDGDPSLDLNNNGIIDSCDIPCPGDIAGGTAKTSFRDGAVSIDDLLVIINHWNETGPPGTVPGDIAPDGAVDGGVSIDDLLRIVNSWGGCP